MRQLGSYYPLIRAFSSNNGSIPKLVDMHRNLQKGCQDSTVLLTMVGNHDSNRLAATIPSLALRKNALAYALLADGIPTIYQGDEQSFAGPGSDPDNREALWTSGFDKRAPLYQTIRKLNKLRSWVGRDDAESWVSKTEIFWSDAHTMALRRGSNGSHIVSILTNSGGNSTTGVVKVKVEKSGFVPGTMLMDIIACKEVAVGTDGALNVAMSNGDPKVLFPVNQLGLSGICGPAPSETNTSSNYLPVSVHGNRNARRLV